MPEVFACAEQKTAESADTNIAAEQQSKPQQSTQRVSQPTTDIQNLGNVHKRDTAMADDNSRSQNAIGIGAESLTSIAAPTVALEADIANLKESMHRLEENAMQDSVLGGTLKVRLPYCRPMIQALW